MEDSARWPRGLSRDEAARYIGIGTTLFDQMVVDGRMPQPRIINSRKVWDRIDLDAAFRELPYSQAAPRAKVFALL